VLTTADVAGGIRKAFALRFADGARGDSDGGANGSITDPGGPVLFAGDPGPTTTTTTTTTSTPGGSTTTTGGGDGSTTTTAGGSATTTTGAGDPGAIDDGTLARTGSEPSGLVAVAAALVALGGLVLAGRRGALRRAR
jgi:hypothetical protein